MVRVVFILSTSIFWASITYNGGFPGGSAIKNQPAMQEMQETWVRSLGWEDPLEESMATHTVFFLWRIPWTEEPGRLQSIDCIALPLGHMILKWLSTLTRYNVLGAMSIWVSRLILCLQGGWILLCNLWVMTSIHGYWGAIRDNVKSIGYLIRTLVHEHCWCWWKGWTGRG